MLRLAPGKLLSVTIFVRLFRLLYGRVVRLHALAVSRVFSSRRWRGQEIDSSLSHRPRLLGWTWVATTFECARLWGSTIQSVLVLLVQLMSALCVLNTRSKMLARLAASHVLEHIPVTLSEWCHEARWCDTGLRMSELLNYHVCTHIFRAKPFNAAQDGKLIIWAAQSFVVFTSLISTFMKLLIEILRWSRVIWTWRGIISF